MTTPFRAAGKQKTPAEIFQTFPRRGCGEAGTHGAVLVLLRVVLFLLGVLVVRQEDLRKFHRGSSRGLGTGFLTRLNRVENRARKGKIELKIELVSLLASF